MSDLWPHYKPAQFEPLDLEEKLAYLIEECSEVQKAACKILRFSVKIYEEAEFYTSPINNWDRLLSEIQDVELAITLIKAHKFSDLK